MYALAVSVTIEDGKEDEAREILRSRIIPMVKEAPGVVAGYWMNPGGGYGYSLVIFDSEENANKGKEMVGTGPRPEFVKLGNIQVMEVIETV
jgi:hypothetical protein